MNKTANEGTFESPGISQQKAVLNAASAYVLELFNKHHDTRLVYNNYQRTAKVVQRLRVIADATEASATSCETAELAAWFHLSGYLKNYRLPKGASLDEATAFLNANHYPSDGKDKVLECLKVLDTDQLSDHPEAQLLKDAIQSVNLTHQFFQERPLLRLEWELMENRRLSPYEWQHLQLQDLLGAQFYTVYAKEQYEPIVGQNLLVQKSKAEKSSRTQGAMTIQPEDLSRPFQGIERKMPTSATQTFFRANYRNHINLSAIADNKANIMISVNAILISVVISILSYRNIPDTNPMVLLPVVIFLVTGLASLICAVLSIRPKVTSLNGESISPEQAKRNIVYFGNFVRLEEEQFEEALDAVLRDGELLYGNMARDLYHLGKVLDQKYRYLTISYNIFMVGFIATVVTFLIAIFV
ncbi:MAG: Pycsar system effector family protein [Bacteroidota bacterium]